MHTFHYDTETAIVRTDRGTVRGYEYDDVFCFKGIPYARAERFHAPQPVEPWEGVLDATNYGYVCPLLDIGRPNGELSVPHRYWPMNEDCLNLNVWTGGLDDHRRPVLVWLHGGGYGAGSSIEQVCYEGENLVRAGDVVVVSINHRLNVLGYMDLSDFGEEYENSGNAGGDDIIAALRWIRDNIAAFGGDPDNVTVFGQSGGGGKVTTLLQSPEADGLFHKGIVMSGVAEGSLTGALGDCVGSGREMVLAMIEETGAGDVKGLEKVPYDVLAAAYSKLKGRFKAEGKNAGDSPFVNAHYAGDPLRVGFRKETMHIPLLVGTTFGEFSGLIPQPDNKYKLDREEAMQFIAGFIGQEAAAAEVPLFEKTYPGRAISDLSCVDILFRPAAVRYISERAAKGGRVWSYLFCLDQPMNGGTAPGHCSDLPYAFFNTELVPSTQDGEITKRVEAQYGGAILAFAKNGDPGHEGLPAWPACTSDTENTMLFDRLCSMRPNHDHALLEAHKKTMGPVIDRMFEMIFSKAQH